jgi:hypothetical protein
VRQHGLDVLVLAGWIALAATLTVRSRRHVQSL